MGSRGPSGWVILGVGVVGGRIGLKVQVGVGLRCIGRGLRRVTDVVGGWIGLKVFVGSA